MKGKLDPPALREALRALTLRRGPASVSDRPKLQTFPGPKIKPLPGQLTLWRKP